MSRARALAAPIAAGIGRWLRRAAGAGVDLLLPPRCPACREIVERDGSFCVACWTGLTFITDPVCARCGVPFDIDRGPGTECGACLAAPPRFAAARAGVVYAGAARTVLLGFKHGDRQHLVRIMAPQLVRAGRDWLGRDALLVPVPLHRGRLWRRGFNQAALLARAAARRSGTPLAVDALVRVRATSSSRGMGRRGRAANVRGAFSVRDSALVEGRDIVLVDDVLTTGATADACAAALLGAGAVRVRVLTWARVVRDTG